MLVPPIEGMLHGVRDLRSMRVNKLKEKGTIPRPTLSLSESHVPNPKAGISVLDLTTPRSWLSADAGWRI